MAGRIRDADVVTVRERASLVEIVGERVQLRNAGGGRLKGLCPFHDEKSPSFSVNPALGFYHCLAGETRVLTGEGTREIRDLAGGTHRILDRSGSWQDAPFRSFGRQRLHEITLSRDGRRQQVRATSGHRWFVVGGGERLTLDLRPADELVSVVPAGDAEAAGWVVGSVTDTGLEEEVFCAEVPDGHAFVLADDILTGNCFGCGQSGDVITFLRETEHLSFVEAIELLAGRFGIELTYEQGSAAAGRQSSQRTRFVEANKLAAAFFTEALASPDAEVARQFLAERGFDREAASTYGLGYAPAGWDALIKVLRAKGFSDAELVGSGLASEGRRGPIDRFRHRLVWPITEMTGEVVGFGARKLSTDGADDSPKYLNTPETALYRKGHVLYGLDKAKKSIARSRQAVVVEGYTDVMACHLAGVPTAVATCGTSFGTDHIALLRRMLMDSGELTGEVIFLFDGDAAGQKAALKAFDSDQSFVTQTFIAVSPGGSDPCELRLAKGDDAVRDLVASRVPLVEFALRSTLERYDLETAEGRVGALGAAAPLVAKIKDRALRPEYARRLAGWLGTDVEVVTGRVAELTGGRGSPPQRRPTPSQRPVDAAALTVEREVVKLAVQAPVLVAPLLDTIGGDAWTDPALRAVRELVEVAGGVRGQPGGEGWVELLREVADQDVVRDMVLRLAVEPIFCDGDVDDRYAAVQLARLQELAFSRRIALLKPALQRVNPVTDVERYTKMFTELVQLEQAMRAVRERGVSDL